MSQLYIGGSLEILDGEGVQVLSELISPMIMCMIRDEEVLRPKALLWRSFRKAWLLLLSSPFSWSFEPSIFLS